MRAFRGRRGGTRWDDTGVVGTARVAEAGQLPQGRWRPGDLAVLDLPHVDEATAEALVQRQASAVLLAGPSTSERYPHHGPERLVEAGILLVDRLGPDLLSLVKDGSTVRVEAGRVLVGAGRDRWVDTETPLQGQEQRAGTVAAAVERASRTMVQQLEAFAETTAAVLALDRDLLLEGAGVPRIPVAMAGRPVVVCVRGYGHEDDLRRLRRFVADRRPVLVGVDDGADALLAAGYRPDVVLTDPDSPDAAGVAAMSCGAHLVVHTRPTAVDGLHGRRDDQPGDGAHDEPEDGADAGGGRRVADDPGSTRFPSRLTTEDTALMLAHGNGAATVVTVGSHATLEEFLDRGRGGSASSFLARLHVGASLVDASTAARLHRPRRRRAVAVLLALALVVTVLAVTAATPWGQEQLSGLLAAVDGAAGDGWWPAGWWPAG